MESLRFVLVAAMFSVAFAGLYLDQSQSGVVTTYLIPSSGIWQSFTPGWSGGLSEVDVYFGMATVSQPCVPYTGVLAIYDGIGTSTSPFFQPTQKLYEQNVTGTCQCNTENCISWQRFPLDIAVPVAEGMKFAFYLSTPDNNGAYRIGVYVADVYQRGTNDFAAPGYDYTFKTYMDTPDIQGIATPLPTDTPTVSNENASFNSGVSASSGSGNLIGIIAGVVGGVAFIALIVAAVIVHRRRQAKHWLSVAEATAEWKRRFNYGENIDSGDNAPGMESYTARMRYQPNEPEFEFNKDVSMLEYEDSNPAVVKVIKRTSAPAATAAPADNILTQESVSEDVFMATKPIGNDLDITIQPIKSGEGVAPSKVPIKQSHDIGGIRRDREPSLDIDADEEPIRNF